MLRFKDASLKVFGLKASMSSIVCGIFGGNFELERLGGLCSGFHGLGTWDRPPQT